MNEMRPLSPQVLQLFAAITRGDKDEAARLLRLGIPINDLDPVSTDSPLMIACRRGFPQLVQLCLDYGAKNDPHPDFGQTALHACVASAQRDCAAVLLQVAAESEADDLICNLTDQNGQTPLHTAAVIGSASLAELLLQHGASLGALDAFGQTPLHLAAGSAAAMAVECLALLLVQGGDDPALLDLPDVFGNTPLHHAAYHGRLEAARLLLQSAADVSLRNAKNLTAYNLATTQAHHPLALLLLDYRDTQIATSRKPNSGLLSTPSHKHNNNSNNRSVWSTPLQSASKRSNGGLLQSGGRDLSYATPLTSERHNNNGNNNNNNKRRTFMHTDFGDNNGMDESLDEPEDDAVYITMPSTPLTSANLSNNINSSSNNMNNSRRRTRSGAEDALQLPRPHTLSQASASPVINSQIKRPINNNHNGNTNNNSNTNNIYNNSNSSAHNTARLEDVSISLVQTDTPLRVAPQSQTVSDNITSHYYHNNSSNITNATSHNSYQQHYGTQSEVTEEPAAVAENYDPAAYDTNTYTTDTGDFVPPLEQFLCLERDWAAYNTEDGFTYFLSNDPVSGEAHSQWEDPRIHGLVLTAATTTYAEWQEEPAVIVVVDHSLNHNTVNHHISPNSDYNDTNDNLGGRASPASNINTNSYPSFSPTGSPRQSISSPSLSQSPSPQRQPPLSPALRTANNNNNSNGGSLQRSPATATASLIHTQQQRNRNHARIKSDNINGSNHNHDSNSGSRLDHSGEISHTQLDLDLEMLNPDQEAEDYMDDDNKINNDDDNYGKAPGSAGSGHSVVRAIDWDKEVNDDNNNNSNKIAQARNNKININEQNKKPKQRKTKSSHAAFLRYKY